MKRWIGKWIIGVSVLHTAFAGIMFSSGLVSIAKKGFFNAVSNDPAIAAVAWFVLFGAVLFVCGLAILALEQTSSTPIPKSIGWSLFVMTAAGILLMPASGFWLLIPPALAILMKKSASSP
jgi:Family of unknown function (DUF6463)